MLLGEILHPETVKFRMEAQDKHEAIDELVDLLVEAHEVALSQRDHIVDVVMQREKTMSTGMENGIALPHGSSDRIDHIIGAMGLAPEGIPFDSLDGKPAQLIILLVMPRNNFQGHVRTLAGVAHLLGNDDARKALLAAKSAEGVVEVIESEEDRDVFYDLRGLAKE
jgi:mannitol/fructose-specific phosphotransferase system IIA component (Ntr-type)